MLDERQMPGVSPVIAGIVRIPEVLHGCTLRLGLLFCKICGRVAIDREAPSLASSSSSSSGTKFTSASARIVAGRGVGRRAWHRPEVPRPKTFQGLVRVMNQMFCGANAKILLGFVHGSRLRVAESVVTHSGRFPDKVHQIVVFDKSSTADLQPLEFLQTEIPVDCGF